MNMRARRIIRADGSVEQVQQRLPMSVLKVRIHADTLDTVQLRHLGQPRMVMLVDDAGHDKGLPVNEEATVLYHANCRPGTTHQIRGDVAVVPDVDFGSHA